jgi:plastocyanin
LAGYHAGDEFTVAIDEFVPRTVRTKVNEPVTWTIVGAHTISFDVPRYVPIYRVRRDGTVKRNPVVDRAAGGSPKAPPVDFERHKLEIDGGTWDGSGFLSSGLLGSEPYSKYTLRVSEPGRYKFACLVHPKMVGTLVVGD